MKYLNTYKIFESKFESLSHNEMKEMYDTCKDICLELEDLEFKIDIGFFYNPWIRFEISKYKRFEYDEVREVIDRLSTYLSDFGFQIEWRNSTEEREKRPTIEARGRYTSSGAVKLTITYTVYGLWR